MTATGTYAGLPSTAADYATGYHYGRAWAEDDARNHVPASDWLETFREESQTGSRWARAFYLGALRGYREECRSEKGGRWGV